MPEIPAIKMPEGWVYQTDSQDSCRFVLGEIGKRMIGCIGINPSTARPGALDNTMKSVKRIASFNGYDGWIMYNLYPQRATNPKKLHLRPKRDLMAQNVRCIKQSIIELQLKNLWLAPGNLIETRGYLSASLRELHTSFTDLNLNWLITGHPTNLGHPRHPLYTRTQSPFQEFDMESYVAFSV